MQLAWHFQSFFITLVHILSSHYCSAQSCLSPPQKVENDVTNCPKFPFVKYSTDHHIIFYNTHSILSCERYCLVLILPLTPQEALVTITIICFLWFCCIYALTLVTRNFTMLVVSRDEED